MDIAGDGMHGQGIESRLATWALISLVFLASSGCQAKPHGIGTASAQTRTAGADSASERRDAGNRIAAAVAMPVAARRALPADANVLLYREQPALAGSAAFSVVVFEQASGPRRTLAVLEPAPGGQWRTAASNLHAVACARCGELLDDPFANGSITLSPDGFVMTQVHGGLHPSSARYAFVRDGASGQWQVGSAEVVHSSQAESGEWTRQVERLAGVQGMAFAAFDPHWRVPEFWNAIVVDQSTGLTTSMFNKPDRKSLDAAIGQGCEPFGSCRTLLVQKYGCLAVAVDDSREFHPAQSLSDGSRAVTDQALSRCKAAGGSGCRVTAKGCSVDSD